MRNAAWRATRAPRVAFTDDDCRPPREWLERALAAASAHPGAVVQGATAPDPDELAVLYGSPHARSQEIAAPSPWAQTCNIVYPRELLERLGGFDEETPLRGAEDTDLALRAAAAGAPYVGAPEALTYHAVADMSLRQRLRWTWPWQNMAYAVRRHPELRRSLPLRIFWKPTHMWLTLALACVAAAAIAWTPWPLLAALPWARETAPRYGRGPRALLRAVLELPSHAVIDTVELVAMARGSLRWRTLLL
jgi:GT2 family glycosyltransferase